MDKRSGAQVFLGVLAAMAACALVSCAKPPLVVGFVGPMTGPSAAVGIECHQGFGLAVAEINRAGGVGGRLIETVVADDAATPEESRRAVEELLARGIRIIVLNTTSGASEGVLDWITLENALVVSQTVSSPLWENRDDAFIRFVSSSDRFSAPLGLFAETLGVRSVAVIEDRRNAAYASSMAAGFLGAAPSIRFLDRRVVDVGMDHAGLAAWVASSGADACFAVLNGLDAAKLAQALERAGYGGWLLLSPWSEDQNLLTYAGAFSDRIYLTTFFDRDSQAPAYRKFVYDYEAVYGRLPAVYGCFGYECARFLFEGVAHARSDSPADVKKALLDLGSFKGLQETVTLDAEGDATVSSLVITIQDGSFSAAR